LMVSTFSALAGRTFCAFRVSVSADGDRCSLEAGVTHFGEAGEIAAASNGHETGATGTDARKTAGIKTDGRVTAETASMSTLARAKTAADTQHCGVADTAHATVARPARGNSSVSGGQGSGTPEASRVTRERIVVLMLASVQFISIVDFMIIMPLGPQLMRKLSIGPQQFGLVVASYTIAAGMAGLIASSLVDRLGRKAAFLGMDAGFLIGTFLCGLAPTYTTLVLARVLTGAFGGILGGLALAIIGDVFPEQDDLRIARHLFMQRQVDRVHHRARVTRELRLALWRFCTVGDFSKSFRNKRAIRALGHCREAHCSHPL